MTLLTGKRSLLPLLILVGLALLPACGKKGPVRPLDKPLPAAPEGAALEQKGGRLLLSWTIPAKNQDGSPAKKLTGFNIYRMSYNPAEDCPECRDTSVLLREIDLEYLQDVRRTGERLTLSDGALQPGTGYRYRIVPFTRKGREGAPAVVQAPFLPPPPSPSGLTALPLDRLVRLTWSAPEGLPEGAGYNIYRAAGEEPFPHRPLNASPLPSPSYEDFSVENDRGYRYVVRSVSSSGARIIESEASAEAEATPREGR